MLWHRGNERLSMPLASDYQVPNPLGVSTRVRLPIVRKSLSEMQAKADAMAELYSQISESEQSKPFQKHSKPSICWLSQSADRIIGDESLAENLKARVLPS